MNKVDKLHIKFKGLLNDYCQNECPKQGVRTCLVLTCSKLARVVACEVQGLITLKEAREKARIDKEKLTNVFCRDCQRLSYIEGTICPDCPNKDMVEAIAKAGIIKFEE